jgi:hypothetical protein
VRRAHADVSLSSGHRSDDCIWTLEVGLEDDLDPQLVRQGAGQLNVEAAQAALGVILSWPWAVRTAKLQVAWTVRIEDRFATPGCVVARITSASASGTPTPSSTGSAPAAHRPG